MVYTRQKEPRSGVMKFSEHLCPKKLMCQFSSDYDIRISDKCCEEIKKKPLHKWQEENNKSIAIIGIMTAEGGQRESAQCLAFKGNKLKAFQPLVTVTKEWEDWLIEKYNIDISDIYRPPYNFVRTGCKGCPFGLNIQHELDILDKFFPAERKQCEIIWRPIYEEYRRLSYRLKPLDEGRQMTLDEFDSEQEIKKGENE